MIAASPLSSSQTNKGIGATGPFVEQSLGRALRACVHDARRRHWRAAHRVRQRLDLLARAPGLRRREVAIRVAIGAGRAKSRQHLIGSARARASAHRRLVSARSACAGSTTRWPSIPRRSGCRSTRRARGAVHRRPDPDAALAAGTLLALSRRAQPGTSRDDSRGSTSGRIGRFRRAGRRRFAVPCAC